MMDESVPSCLCNLTRGICWPLEHSDHAGTTPPRCLLDRETDCEGISDAAEGAGPTRKHPHSSTQTGNVGQFAYSTISLSTHDSLECISCLQDGRHDFYRCQMETNNCLFMILCEMSRKLSDVLSCFPSGRVVITSLIS